MDLDTYFLRTVTMRLRLVENEMGKSLYRIDNVSLSYTNWGVQLSLGD